VQCLAQTATACWSSVPDGLAALLAQVVDQAGTFRSAVDAVELRALVDQSDVRLGEGQAPLVPGRDVQRGLRVRQVLPAQGLDDQLAVRDQHDVVVLAVRARAAGVAVVDHAGGELLHAPVDPVAVLVVAVAFHPHGDVLDAVEHVAVVVLGRGLQQRAEGEALAVVQAALVQADADVDVLAVDLLLHPAGGQEAVRLDGGTGADLGQQRRGDPLGVRDAAVVRQGLQHDHAVLHRVGGCRGVVAGGGQQEQREEGGDALHGSECVQGCPRGRLTQGRSLAFDDL
jgi:hypothetical protein